jgi:hypothetical protein
MEIKTENLASIAQRLGGSLLGILLRSLTAQIGYLVWSIVLWQKGETPNKQILKMKIISSVTHKPITAKHLALRQLGIPLAYIGAVLAAGGIGLLLDLGPIFAQILTTSIWIVWIADRLWIFKGQYRQRLTDKLMKTYVIKVGD